MKSKSDLKKKVLCSLLAASTLGIFYSNDALAADVDHILVKGDEMSADVVNPSEGKGGYIYGVVGGNAYVDSTTTEYDEWDDTTEIVAGGLKGTVASVNGIVSSVGQMVGLDQSIINAVGSIDAVLQKTESANAQTDTTINKDTGLYLENYGYDWVRYYGAIGGDVSVNTGLQGSATLAIGDADGTELLKESEATSIVRNGNINNTINSGSVIGGIGASAAVAVGNISAVGEVEKSAFGLDVKVEADLTTNGKTTTTINDDVKTIIAPNANAIGWTNGGTAIGLGGTAESTINGNTILTIDGTDRAAHAGAYEKPGANDILPQLTTALNIMKGSKINAIGVTGGGMAVTTLGGKAESNVSGTTTININNATVLGAIGGGIAGSVDATGVAEQVYKPNGKELQLGNDAGYVDITGAQLEALLGTKIPDSLKITATDAVNGGTAAATTSDTNINLTGNSAAVGVIGGGVAAASHTYTWKNDGTNKEAGLGEDDVNKAYGNSTATATTGVTHINIALDEGAMTEEGKKDLVNAVSSFKDKLVNNTNDLQADELKALANKGAAVGVFGGGVALAQGYENSIAEVENAGAEINLDSGYAVGVFGGGVAAASGGTPQSPTPPQGGAQANADTNGTINMYISDGMEAVGVFGNGFAYYTAGNGAIRELDQKATVTAQDSNIYVTGGSVDGLLGGGLALDDTKADKTNAVVTTEGKATINVTGGEVNELNFGFLQQMVGKPHTAAGQAPEMDNYVDSVAKAADGVAIAAGGTALGGGAESTVNEAEVNIAGGTVTGHVIAGGVAGYGYAQADNDNKGAYVGTSTLNLTGGTVTGNVYAGGSADTEDVSNQGNGSYTEAYAQVGNATINLAGTEVEGFLSGAGVSGKENDKALNSILNVSGENTLALVDDNGTKVSKINAFKNTNFEAGSVTTLDSSLTAGNTVAVIDAKLSDTENGVITVANGAKLDISKLTVDKENAYLVASNFADNSTLWGNDALVYDRTENYAEAINADNNYSVSYKDLNDLTEEEQDKAVNDFVGSLGEGGEELRGNVEGIVKNGDNTFAGAKDFFGDFTSGNGSSHDLAAMAMIGEAAGVSSNTISVAGDMADNSVLRLSFTQDDITGEPTVNEDGAVWAKYIHNKHDLDGMASSFGSIDSNSDFDGATIGVDFAKKGKVQSGIAFSYGDGDSHGMGINNDFDMWGVTLYGNVKNDDTNVIADIGFSESDNELTGKAMGKDIKADRNVSVFTVGVRAEKLYTEGSTQIVPYTGLRYYNVDPDSYTAYYDGAKFGEYDADRQNIWTLPVGVSLRNETVTESGWKIVPQANVAYIWAFGDTDNSFDLNTGSGVSTLDYTVMDSGSWLGSLGIEAGKDDWNFGLGYSYQKGSHAEANKWFVNVEYSF